MRNNAIYTGTIKDRVYDVLRQEIMDGKLRPGDKIVEQNIADRLNVSRSPVREAVKQLIGDGLLLCIPNKGAFVKQLSFKEVQDSNEVRILLEMYAINHINEKQREKNVRSLERLRKKIQQSAQDLSVTGYMSADRDLHMAIVQLCNNQVVVQFYEKLWGQIASFRTISLMNQEQWLSSVQEHLGIIDSLLAHDDEKAAQIMLLHLNEAKNTVERYLRTFLPQYGDMQN